MGHIEATVSDVAGNGDAYGIFFMNVLNLCQYVLYWFAVLLREICVIYGSIYGGKVYFLFFTIYARVNLLKQ